MASNNCQLNQLERSKHRFANCDEIAFVFVKKYAKYLQQKLSTYRLLSQDVNKLCKLHQKSKEEESFHQHDLASEQFIRKLAAIQQQVETIYTEYSPIELNSLLTSRLFERHLKVLERSLLKVFFRLWIDDLLDYEHLYERTMQELLEHFELMSKKHCKETIELYKRMPSKTQKLLQHVQLLNVELLQHNFNQSADLPTPQVPGVPLLDQLEMHLANLENKPKRK